MSRGCVFTKLLKRAQRELVARRGSPFRPSSQWPWWTGQRGDTSLGWSPFSRQVWHLEPTLFTPYRVAAGQMRQDQRPCRWQVEFRR